MVLLGAGDGALAGAREAEAWAMVVQPTKRGKGSKSFWLSDLSLLVSRRPNGSKSKRFRDETCPDSTEGGTRRVVSRRPNGSDGLNGSASAEDGGWEMVALRLCGRRRESFTLLTLERGWRYRLQVFSPPFVLSGHAASLTPY